MTNEAPNYLSGNGKKKWLIIFVVVAVVGLTVGIIIGLIAGPKKTVLVEPSATSTPVVLPEPEKPKIIKTPLGEFTVENPEQTILLAPEKVEEAVKKENVFKISIASTGFSPSEFTVEAGQSVFLILEAVDGTHSFAFESPDLADIYMGVALGETRGRSFITPTKIGDYVFFCREPGHRERGEQGVMRVR